MKFDIYSLTNSLSNIYIWIVTQYRSLAATEGIFAISLTIC